MTREQKLIAWAGSMIGVPFAWGQTDCALLALTGIDAMLGTCHAERYRGAWESQEQALAHFTSEIPSSVLEGLGAVERDPSLSSVGDVLTVPADVWPEQMSLILGSRVLCADISRGVCLKPLRLFARAPGARAWRFA